MNTSKIKTVNCPVGKVIARIAVQSFYASGIGDSHAVLAKDYSCNQESSCQSRGIWAACPVRLLNQPTS